MDYSQLSDFEINKRVGIALGKELRPDDCQDFGLSGLPEVMLRSGDIKDYCNDPADAWPIIVDNEISLISRCANGEWKAQLHLGRDDIFDSYASCWDIKPLRAAMIVFLMMKEQSHE